MVYAVAKILNLNDDIIGYKLVDEYTYSVFDCRIQQLKKVLRAIGCRNIYIEADGNIYEKQWSLNLPTINTNIIEYTGNTLFSIEKSILLNVDYISGMCCTVNKFGNTSFMSVEHVIGLVKSGRILNAEWNLTSIDLADVSAIKYDKKHEEIEHIYNNYQDKSLAIGLDQGFKYHIINNKVVVDVFTGCSKELYIPDFVSCIRGRVPSTVEKIHLREGLEVIGDGALIFCQDTNVIIPSTVKLFCGTMNSVTFYNKKCIRTADIAVRSKDFY